MSEHVRSSSPASLQQYIIGSQSLRRAVFLGSMGSPHTGPSRLDEGLEIQEAKGDLESQLRGMILRNATSPISTSSQRHQTEQGTVQGIRPSELYTRSPAQVTSAPLQHQQIHEGRQYREASNMVHPGKRNGRFAATPPTLPQVAADMSAQAGVPHELTVQTPTPAPKVGPPKDCLPPHGQASQTPPTLPASQNQGWKSPVSPPRPWPARNPARSDVDAGKDVNIGAGKKSKPVDFQSAGKTIINRGESHQKEVSALPQKTTRVPAVNGPDLAKPQPQPGYKKSQASSSSTSGGVSLLPPKLQSFAGPNKTATAQLQQEPVTKRLGALPLQHRPVQINQTNGVQGPQGNPRPPPNGYNYAQRSGPSGQNHGNSPGWRPFAAIDLQARYMEELANAEIAAAAADKSQTLEKEQLRRTLEMICRDVIGDYEQVENPSFDRITVVLVPFGSLTSGFATRSSDMDLTLQSPQSVPDLASNESVIPRLIEKALMEKGYGVRLLTRARVPIIKLCQHPSPELSEALRQERIKWENTPVTERKDELEKSKLTGKKKKHSRRDKETRAYHSKLKTASKEEELRLKQSGETRDGDSDEDTSSEDDEGPASVEGAQLVHAGTNSQIPDKNEKIRKEKEPKPEQIIKPFPFEDYSDENLLEILEIAINEGWFNDDERDIVQRFSEAVRKQSLNDSHNEPKLIAAREEIKQLSSVLKKYRPKRERDTSLDFPKNGVGIQCDINFSNELAIHNTELLRCYSHCHPVIRKLVIFVKAWAKKRKINSPYQGTLSSYGYVLMVLHYAVNVAEPPLAPNLQLHQRAQREVVNGHNVTFWRNEKEIIDQGLRNNYGGNRASLGEHLRQFFTYYAWQNNKTKLGGFIWATQVLSLRTQGGILLKKDKNWVEMTITKTEAANPNQEAKEVKNRHLFCIEDPFELEHNVARTVDYDGINRIRDEFKRACDHFRYLGEAQKGKITNLFEEAEEPVRPYRFFGPRPKLQHLGPVQGCRNLPKEKRPTSESSPPEDPKPSTSELANSKAGPSTTDNHLSSNEDPKHTADDEAKEFKKLRRMYGEDVSTSEESEKAVPKYRF